MTNVTWSNNTSFPPTTTTTAPTHVMGLNDGDDAKFVVSPTPANRGIPTWNANSNFSANNFLTNFASIVTSGGTTTLTVASAGIEEFTGTMAQTVVMPVVSTLVAGQQFIIINNSSGDVTVNSSGASVIQIMDSDSTLILTCVSTSGVTAASWQTTYIASGSSGGVTAQQVQQSAFNLGIDSGTSNNYVITLDPPISGLTNGLMVAFVPQNVNTAPIPLVTIDGFGSEIYRLGYTGLAVGDMQPDFVSLIYYTNSLGFILLNPAQGYPSISSVQQGFYNTGNDSGTADNYVITVNPDIPSYTNGLMISFTPANTNLTTSPTLNVSGKGVKPIERSIAVPAAIGDLSTGQLAVCIYSQPSDSFLLLTPAT